MEAKQEEVNAVEEAKLPAIAAAIHEADAILILTGAGMGVRNQALVICNRCFLRISRWVVAWAPFVAPTLVFGYALFLKGGGERD